MSAILVAMPDNHSVEDPTASLIEVIARLRREAGMTLEDLADRAGLHRTSLGLIERGKRGLTLESTSRIARALDMDLAGLVALGDANAEGATHADTPMSPRRLHPRLSGNDSSFRAATGLPASAIRDAIEHVYTTLDLIDAELTARGSEAISGLVELANLSSMVGNLIGAGIEDASNGKYLRNRPHAFPDLIPQLNNLPNLEIKTALEQNKPKGHLPKEGMYLTFRYVLGGPDGSFKRGKDNRGKTVWIWEVRFGHLYTEDFSISNTDGDSGKTAVIKTDVFKSMKPVFFDPRFFPYAGKAWGGLRGSDFSWPEV